MVPADLEQPIDRALKRLPALHAPATLLPRVMAAVQQWAAKPWYERAWFTWPRSLQIASATAVFLLIVALWAAAPLGRSAMERLAQAAASAMGGELSDGMQRVDATVSGAQVLWRALVAPVLAYAAILVVIMYLACATFAVALGRVLFGKAVES